MKKKCKPLENLQPVTLRYIDEQFTNNSLIVYSIIRTDMLGGLTIDGMSSQVIETSDFVPCCLVIQLYPATLLTD